MTRSSVETCTVTKVTTIKSVTLDEKQLSTFLLAYFGLEGGKVEFQCDEDYFRKVIVYRATEEETAAGTHPLL